ncbi:MAG: hypothetical protein ACI89L_000229 [Phycisphaerales bacterium]|jgi:hypothetical protein
MTLTARLSLIHVIGASLLLAALSGGYQFAYRPAVEARSLAAGLRLRLSEHRAELVSLQRQGGARATAAAEPAPQTPPGEPEIRPMTPTAFLSAFERLAREVGLRVESSIELEPAADEAAEIGTTGPGLLVEVTGKGTFSQVVELCGSVHGPLPGLEIRLLRITRGTGEQVRWTMVCKNHDGPAG